MKIIFLDIDDVLNTSETYDKIYNDYKSAEFLNIEIDEFRVEYLKRIIHQTEAKIVLSSSWRDHFYKNNNIVVPKTKKGLDLYHILKKYDIEIYDLTTKDYDKTREEQINLWLNEHDDIDSFVIIDDESSDLKGFINKELIKTSVVPDGKMLMNMDDCTGLCEQHIEQAIKILNKRKLIKK